MQWFNKLKTTFAAVIMLLTSVSSVVADSYADDTWDFSDTEEFIVPEHTSDIPRWVIVPYRDTYLWDGCKLFVEEHSRALAGVSATDCVDIIAEVSGLRNPDWISAGAMVMVPSPNNTSAEITERRSKFANLPVWARNPIGMTARLAEFNRDIDAINQRLDEVEERLDEHGGRLTNQANQLSDLETQVATLAQTAGANLSTAEVRVIATEVLEEVDIQPGMTESEVQSQIQSALAEQGTEFTQLASDVEALRRELQSLRSGTSMSPEVYAQAAITIAQDLGMSEADVDQAVSQALAELDLVSLDDVSEAIDEALDERDDGDRVTASQDISAVGGYEIPTWMLWIALIAFGVLTLLLLGLKTFLDKRRSKEFSDRLGTVEKEFGPLKDRLEVVEDAVGLLMELDAQDRFNNPDLTEDLVQNLKSDGDPLILRVKCLDGKIRHVHVTRGQSGDGKPQLEFLGLEKGQDFVGTVTLTALQKHLRKAVKQDWVIGVQKARLVA